jgi:hypothetical protein
MRRVLLQATPLAAALGLGAVAGCYHEDFLLGAYCVREDDCGADQCCASGRCRPRGNCALGPNDVTPFEPAYKPCDSEDECLVHGLVRCVRWDDAPIGFCTDLCIGDPLVNCENHTFEYYSTTPLPRTCVTVDDQEVCALDCAGTDRCPPDMTCRTGVCVPTPQP